MAIGMAKVEEGEVGIVKYNPNEDLCTRTPWVDARIALDHIKKGRATGNRGALLMRQKLQDQFILHAAFVARNAGKILFVALLVGAVLCVGLKSARWVTDLEKLWVEEDGRLEREMEYVSKTLGDGAGTKSQILIQTSKDVSGGNMLTPASLLTHLNILYSATSVSVELFESSWGLRDICLATTFPSFENHMIDTIFEKLTPCAIITPLDCFWEGSKLLGPEEEVRIPGFEKRKWTNINPQAIVDKITETHNSDVLFPLSSFSKFLKMAGISTAYQEKPCLNPADPECPETAPNKNSNKTLDVGAELTGGCFGFASKFLHWPEELIIGGTTVNRTQHIKRAEALQSLVQLMGENNLFEYWKDHYKVIHLDWSKQKAKLILDAWVHKFSKTVEEESQKLENEAKHYYNIYPFSSATLNDLLQKMSHLDPMKLGIGFAIMTVYVCFCLMNTRNSQNSFIGLGFTGVVLMAGAVASGFGLCVLLSLPFNAASTQVLPFLALGLGINDVFLLVHSVRDVSQQAGRNGKVCELQEALKRTGISVLMSSLCRAGAFFAASVIPVPALRLLCLQAGILMTVSLVAVLIVFPALMYMDIHRRKSRRLDVFCCIPLPTEEEGGSHQELQASKKVAVVRAVPKTDGGTVTQVLCPKKSPEERWVGAGSVKDVEAAHLDQVEENHRVKSSFYIENVFECGYWSLQEFISKTYAPALGQKKVKILTVLLLITSIIVSLYGVAKITNGLDITDIVPRGTMESRFLKAQEKYFGFYYMFAITKGNFEYHTNQKLLHDYHQSFSRIPWILKNSNGGLPDGWLILFRNWLLELQKAFDKEWKSGSLTEEGWKRESSNEAILAYKLLMQTGNIDDPFNRSLVSQNRLVDEEGIINQKAFYIYLTAWYSNDPMTYTISQADIHPVPRVWYHDRYDTDVEIPKSSKITYSQFPFLLYDLKTTESITQMITYVREICQKFEEQGLPNFPSGIPFTFWEQYINLRFYLLLSLGTVLGGIFVLMWVSLVNIWASALYVLSLAVYVLQLIGILGLLELKLSAISAVLLVISVGIGGQMMLHVLLGFLTAIGNSNKRAQMAVEKVATYSIQSGVSTLLAILMLFFSEFDFIRRYFFYVLGAMVILGLIHGLLFFPVILSVIGPPSEVIPKFSSDRLPLPTPPPSPLPPSSSRQSSRSHSHCGRSRSSRMYPNIQGSNLSLTTITEESASADSCQVRSSGHEIIIEPQVVVETTSKPNQTPSDSGESVVFCDGGHITTTVTATAKVKVEVHSQIKGFVDASTKSTSDSQSSGKSSYSRTPRSSPSSSYSNSRSHRCPDGDSS